MVDERAYNRSLRRLVLSPLFADLRQRLGVAISAPQAYGIIAAQPMLIPDGTRAVVVEQLDAIDAYHLRRTEQTFRAGLGVDIRPRLTRPAIATFLDAKVAENVSLIRTIPPRAHEGLTNTLRRMLRDTPFDQQVLQRALRSEFRSTGFNLRRLTRDQSSKLVGNLTQIRNQQLGVRRYVWRTAGDERVRESHAIQNGVTYEWASPPPNTGHPGQDIQCRCVAIPIVRDER